MWNLFGSFTEPFNYQNLPAARTRLTAAELVANKSVSKQSLSSKH